MNTSIRPIKGTLKHLCDIGTFWGCVHEKDGFVRITVKVFKSWWLYV